MVTLGGDQSLPRPDARTSLPPHHPVLCALAPTLSQPRLAMRELPTFVSTGNTTQYYQRQEGGPHPDLAVDLSPLNPTAGR